MGWAGWGGADRSTIGYTDNAVWVDGIGIPLGRAMGNGSRPIIVTHLEAWVRGRNAPRGGVLKMEASGGGALFGDTDWFTVPAAGSAAATGHIGGVNAGFHNGGNFRFVIDMDGSFWFGRGGGGGPSWDTYGTSWDQTLAGAMTYVEGPSEPGVPSAVANGKESGRIDLSWAAPFQDGGTPINGYRILWSTNLTALNAGTAQGSYDVPGNWATFHGTPGTTYYFRIAAKNWVSDWAGTTSHWSVGSGSATAPGLPGAPTGLTATPSTNTFGRMSLSWTAPSLAPGGITRYNIYSGSTLLGTSTTTTFTADGLPENTSVSFTVRARNAFADNNNTTGPASNTATATVPGRPGAPQNLSAVASATTAGRVTLTWTAPSTTAGGITQYRVYRSTGDLLTTTAGNVTTATIDGLTPGDTYRFYVTALNAVGQAGGNVSGPQSNIATATALGEPGAPTGVTLIAPTTVANRLRLSWNVVTGPGTITGYNVYDASTNTLIKRVTSTGMTFDNLNPGLTYRYYVRTVNSAGLSPASPTVSGSPGDTTSQAVTTGQALTDTTNSTLNGTYTIAAITATSISYLKPSTTLPRSAVANGSVVNNTNTTLNGTYTIATPTTTTMTYAKTASNIPSTPVTSGTATDNTNVSMNGNYTVSAINAGANQVSYAKTMADVTSRAATGILSNKSNTAINGTSFVVTAVTPRTFSYNKAATNVADSVTSGTVHNRTNDEIYNGVKTVLSIPSYNTFTYTAGASGVTPYGSEVPILSPYGTAHRDDSPAFLKIMYRSGWAG